MTRINRVVVACFLGGLALVVVAASAADLWIAWSLPAGSTISWSMALAGDRSPLLAFVVGHVTGGILWGLAVHFWNPMGRPVDAETIRLQAAEIAEYRRMLGVTEGED